MTDLRIQYNEEMVGANHSTKTDTLNRLALAEHNTDGSHAVANESIRGLVVSRHDDANLAISAGFVVIDDGAAVQRRALAANTTKAHGQSGGAAETVYVYIDPDAASGGVAPALNDNNIIVSTTAPVWSGAKQGLYHPADTGQRCVGVWMVDSSNHSEAWHAELDGETVYFDGNVAVVLNATNTGFNNQDCTDVCPAVAGAEVLLLVRAAYVSGGTGSVKYRRTGSGDAGNLCCTVNAAGAINSIMHYFETSANPNVDFNISVNTCKYSVWANGWRMRR